MGLVVECSGANIALKQAIEMLRPNGEVVRVGMGFKPLEFSINDITHGTRALSDIWHMTPHHGETRSAFLLPVRQSTADDHSQTWTFRVGKRI